jgi:hypothetical protein
MSMGDTTCVARAARPLDISRQATRRAAAATDRRIVATISHGDPASSARNQNHQGAPDAHPTIEPTVHAAAISCIFP